MFSLQTLPALQTLSKFELEVWNFRVRTSCRYSAFEPLRVHPRPSMVKLLKSPEVQVLADATSTTLVIPSVDIELLLSFPC